MEVQVKTPLQYYQQAISSGHFVEDKVQEKAVILLDKIWYDLVDQDKQKKSFFSFFKKKVTPKGIYMWGGVGRGKTWLMDTFFDSLPIKEKMRMHFHHFMQYVHKELNRLSGQQNPLDEVAKIILSKTTVICFDEFFVTNVTDAMILSDLFQKLFTQGITLIATSNIEPSSLYKDGIHRDRFLPTIGLLEKNCTILNVDAGIDYRLRILKQAELFKFPLSIETTKWLEQRFEVLTIGQKIDQEPIVINHRNINVVKKTNDILWCSFNSLCREPRSPSDFIEIANKYTTVLVSDIPHLNDQINDITRRFIYLVDEFYDRKVKLIITSENTILDLYQGKRLAFEIQRTQSRLLEMQSDEYLNSAHRLD